MVPELTTLDDLEELLCTLVSKHNVSYGAHYENLNEDYIRAFSDRDSPITLVSSSIRFLWIFAGVS